MRERDWRGVEETHIFDCWCHAGEPFDLDVYRILTGFLDRPLRGADASHAWVAVWCGEAAGWVHLDPTNDLIAHEDHVAVAWGRDFSDVSPLRSFAVVLSSFALLSVLTLELLRRGYKIRS